MQKINLLYVITKLELGGAQKQLLSLINHLDRQRFSLFLFTAREGLLLQDARAITDLTLRTSKWLERPINPLKDLLALIDIYWFIKNNNIEIVHTHSSKAGILGRLAAKCAKVKVVIHTVHGWSFNEYQPFFMRKIFIWLERLTAQFTHKLIVVSYYDKQKGLGSRIANENKYLLIRYGIDYSEFSRTDQDIKKELGINPNDLVIGMISCLKPQKCPQDFIKLAFLVNKAYANIKFLLVGDGILRKRVQNLINSFGLHNNVILTGWRRDIPRILTTIDVFVLTSLWEGFPISALEALASSKPVVATNTGGIEEIVVEGKNGFLVQPGDIKSLSERLNVLLRNNDLRKAIAHNAKSSLNFSAENMIRNNQSLYETLLRQNN